MAKVARLVILALLINTVVRAQTTYGITYITDDSAAIAGMGFPKSFPSRGAAMEYVAKAPALLQSKGYITASVDSAQFDSLQAAVHLYLGEQYKWAEIKTNEKDAALLEAVHWNSHSLQNRPMNFTLFQN